MSTVNIRIDEKTKKAARKTLEAMGLDLSTGVKLFLNQVVIAQGIPFNPTKNPAALRTRWNREVLDAKSKGRKYSSAAEVLEDL
jgi:DNA-damage-inducible protein J